MTKNKISLNYDISRIIFGTAFIILFSYALYHYFILPFGMAYKISKILQLSATVILALLLFLLLVWNSRKAVSGEEPDFDVGLGEPAKKERKLKPEEISKSIGSLFVELKYQLKSKNIKAAEQIYQDITQKIKELPAKDKENAMKKCLQLKKEIDEAKKKPDEPKENTGVF